MQLATENSTLPQSQASCVEFELLEEQRNKSCQYAELINAQSNEHRPCPEQFVTLNKNNPAEDIAPDVPDYIQPGDSISNAPSGCSKRSAGTVPETWELPSPYISTSEQVHCHLLDTQPKDRNVDLSLQAMLLEPKVQKCAVQVNQSQLSLQDPVPVEQDDTDHCCLLTVLKKRN